MKKDKYRRRISNFVQMCKRDGVSGLIILGDEVNYTGHNFGDPERKLWLLTALLDSFRQQAPDHWDELKTAIFEVLDAKDREENHAR